jgi:hypothetical protein
MQKRWVFRFLVCHSERSAFNLSSHPFRYTSNFQHTLPSLLFVCMHDFILKPDVCSRMKFEWYLFEHSIHYSFCFVLCFHMFFVLFFNRVLLMRVVVTIVNIMMNLGSTWVGILNHRATCDWMRSVLWPCVCGRGRVCTQWLEREEGKGIRPLTIKRRSY